MNIENIEAFIYVCQLGSFNKAAEALYLTQPSVTARIQSLEREINIKLFHRNGNKISLTEKGEYFFPHAQKILQSYQEAKYGLQQVTIPYDLVIGSALSISNNILPEILPGFKSEFKDVRIKIVTGHSQDILQKVINKEVDFGIVRTETHPQVESIRLYNDPIGLFVPRNHIFLKEEKVTIEHVSKQPLIFFDYGSMDWLMIHRLFSSNDVSPNISLEVDNMETAKNLVIQGMGISFLPEHCVKQELENGELIRVEMTPPVKINISIDFIYLKGRPKSVFIDFLKEKMCK
ncbi:LysR family transcriptional regulator [Bacillus pacificus]|jgi:DNA-binding transcriptional LysR family regulator|uniref:HTH-type transcriptional regulator CzcR n=1 Tax=Bacillus pacificus TaxID=2026187 RepID=A0AAP4FPN2_9BACI|nr:MULTISPECIES: LysR family transcriptional regulator [Bacillus]KMQ31476.1 LysR family transcriptional regulator [Bacillus cereus]MCU5160463.1 LysR family transcriptional regulator [Bacillus pacificus]MCU9945773.1 LysR family transcriptional regulator [Bacillus pacificus]MCX3303301.1 LysR family transcriptional regulator [Bacillus pacificus]MCX3330035.1 LysR family transcriptional regulator [Bacillus pacificus]